MAAGVVELSLYATRASDEALSLGLFMEALFETRVGNVWMSRLGLAFLAVLAITLAVRVRLRAVWLGAAGVGSVSLLTLTQLSHAAAEGRFLPFFADWAHVIAGSLWMGGLLGFPLILAGPLRALPEEQRTKLRRESVRRFSRIALVSVTVLAATGVYASLLHIPDIPALFGTPYGVALCVKLFLVALLLAAGAANLMLKGRGPFQSVVSAELALAVCVFIATGFLTSLPPP
ncbi:MAG: copper resistance D family protein [Rubrobacteraceae bacterium]